MDNITLSLVRMAQELCNSGTNPRQATKHLLDAANTLDDFAFLKQANQEKAITELERRFSGYTTKPWESVQ